MRKTRVFVQAVLTIGEVARLEGEAAHHLGRVLKLRQGDIVQAFNGNGGYFESEIVGVEKRSMLIRPGRFINDDRESALDLTLAQGISRGRHMDYTIQKAVELGIRKIVPLVTEFSNVKLEADRARNRIDHWQKVIINACEQSGRSVFPRMTEPAALTEWVRTDTSSEKLVLHPDADRTISTIKAENPTITLLCGPEGGLSAAELDLARTRGYQVVSLGPRVLRTETAAVAAIVQCQSRWGDMG